jgi:hypothetical protein
MKIGDLVRYLTPNVYGAYWLGIIVQEGPIDMKLKTVQWTQKSGGVDRGAYAEKDLVLVNENR